MRWIHRWIKLITRPHPEDIEVFESLVSRDATAKKVAVIAIVVSIVVIIDRRITRLLGSLWGVR